ncbi:hypothetical protein ACIP80_04790 [Streptomyces sp. NPDC088555]|uniref:hypothetical protein n=1 Tax=Streptomyces sp. NPDC088555 TaxID=3365866 RepID=UPI00383062BC
MVESSFIASVESTSEWDSPALTLSGTYTLVLRPQNTGTGKLTLTLSNPTVVPELTTTGPPADVTIDRCGQNAESTFQATAEDDLSLSSSGNTFTTFSSVTVLAPSGAKVIDGATLSVGPRAHSHGRTCPRPACTAWRSTPTRALPERSSWHCRRMW